MLYIGIFKSLIAAFYIIRHTCKKRPDQAKNSTPAAEHQSVLREQHNNQALNTYEAPLSTATNRIPLAITEIPTPLVLNENQTTLALTEASIPFEMKRIPTHLPSTNSINPFYSFATHCNRYEQQQQQLNNLALRDQHNNHAMNRYEAPLALTTNRIPLAITENPTPPALNGNQTTLAITRALLPIEMTGIPAHLSLANAIIPFQSCAAPSYNRYEQQQEQRSIIPLHYYEPPQNEQQQSTIISMPISQNQLFNFPSAPPTENNRADYFESSIFTSTQLENPAHSRSTIYKTQDTISSLSKKKQKPCGCGSLIGACKANSSCTCVTNKRKCTDACHKPNAKCINPFF